jgi:DNA-binding NarL/FixJ family response regulator
MHQVGTQPHNIDGFETHGPQACAITVRLWVDQPLVCAGLRAALQGHQDIRVDDDDQSVGRAWVTRGPGLFDVAVIEAASMLLKPRRDAISDAGLHMCERVVAVGGRAAGDGILSAIRCGVRGFVSERAVVSELPHAVRAIAQGRAFVSPDFAGGLLEWLAGHIADDPVQFGRAAEQLSNREQEVLVLLGGGLDNAEIARRLVISETTVRSHVYHIMTKLNLRSRTQAVLFGYRFQLAASNGQLQFDGTTGALSDSSTQR